MGLGAAAEKYARVQMQRYRSSSVYQLLLQRALAAVSPEVFQHCPGLVSSESTFSVLKTVEFGVDGRPEKGAWRQSFPVSGCGNDTTLNFTFVATPSERVEISVEVPGETHANLALQRDAFRFAQTTVSPIAKPCRSFDVTNTKFDGFDASEPSASPSAEATPPWRETWTLIGCGKRYSVRLSFQAHEKGTQIVADPAEMIQ